MGSQMMRKVPGTMGSRLHKRSKLRARIKRRFTFRIPAARFQSFFNSLLITQLMGVQIKKRAAKKGSRAWRREQRRDRKGRFA